MTKLRIRHWLALKGQGPKAVLERKNGFTVTYHLHLEPEETTFPANGFRSNQLNNIALLSEWAGRGSQVLVKEHPVILAGTMSLPYAVRNRTRTFYEAIRRLPNVVLLKPKGVANQRVTDSDAIATVGGNVGWEALRAGLPVIHFGVASYGNAVGAYRWRSNLSLNEVVIRDGKEIAEAAEESIRLLERYSYDETNPNRRVGRVLGLLAALDAIDPTA